MLVVVTLVLLVLYALLIFFYWYHWQKEEKGFPGTSVKTFISVIIPARNEEKSLPRLLRRLEEQTYKDFEILVIDDYSTDSTTNVILPYLNDRVWLLRPSVPEHLSSKKRAIERGVRAAKGELIVVTDADCYPGMEWLETINKFYQARQSAFIASPVKYQYKENLVEMFQTMDFMILQGITAAGVRSGLHTMCNGANLAYTKQAFEEVNGFEGIDKIATGDDMLLMHKIRKRNPGKVDYLKSREAIVLTSPMSTWRDFFMQRRRWASKSLNYDDKSFLPVLILILMLNLWFFVLIIASFFNSDYWIVVLALIAAKTLIEYPFVKSIARFYNEQKLMKYFLLFQPLHIFYTVFVGIYSQFGKYEWKGRVTK